MTDQSNASGQQATNDPQGPQISVLGQYIKDLSFENPKAPQSLREPGENPNLKVEVNVNAKPIEDEVYESEIVFNARTTSSKGDLYQLEMVYAGVFRLANIPKDAIQPVLLINCPSLLFPYLRRTVADLTREGGFPPLLLDPIDFASLLARKRAQAGDQDNATAQA